MYKRVLVPVDGSPLAEAILPFVMEVAGPLDMAVVLLRILEPIPPMAIEGTRHAAFDDVTARQRDAEEYLARLAAGLRVRGVRVSCEVRVGRPAERILETARDTSSDLIAMSTHGRSGLGRLLFGSVAEQVLREAEVPVFLMRGAKSPASATATRRT